MAFGKTRDDAQKAFVAGKHLMACHQIQDALLAFRWAHEIEPNNPEYASYYGLMMVEAGVRSLEGLRMCRRAASQAFYRAELFTNLAKAYLSRGDRTEAERALRKGLALEPDNGEIRALLKEIGVRRPPLLGFLDRRNPVNRLAGRVRHRMLGSGQ